MYWLDVQHLLGSLASVVDIEQRDVLELLEDPSHDHGTPLWNSAEKYIPVGWITGIF